jgi:hypothetical protein
MTTDETDVARLREEIAQTREDLGRTVEALAAKADVKGRASRAMHDAAADAKARAHEVGTLAVVEAGTAKQRLRSSPKLAAGIAGVFAGILALVTMRLLARRHR